MKTPPFGLLLAAMCLACWPVWMWFVTGTLDGSNDAAGLLAAAAAIACVVRAPVSRTVAWPLALPIATLVVYLAATLAGVAPGVCAVIVALGLASLASACRLGRRLDIAIFGLCLLALPLTASLQFYAGYPLRVMAGELALVMLKLNGIGVVREGAMLVWQGQLVSIDAPCSGLKMLWAGLFLACALAAGTRLNGARTLLAIAVAVVIVIAANALRAGSLFFVETGIVHLAPWSHQGIGVVCFVVAAVAILASIHQIKGVRP